MIGETECFYKIMTDKLGKVNYFHHKFKLGTAKAKPHFIESKDYNLRFELMKEENEEYLEACKNDDLIEIADALGDKLYILCGTILKHGMQNIIDKVFQEIHASNLSKLDENNEPIFRDDGKILKGKKYFPPNIKKILDS